MSRCCSSKKRSVISITTIRTFSTTSSTQKPWRKILEDHANKNNIGLQDWYRVDVNNLDDKTTQLLKKEFKSSLYRALSVAYPETEWHPWKFEHERIPVGYWKEQSNQRKFFDDLGKKLGVSTLGDWYQKLSRKQIRDNGGRTLLSAHNESPVGALMAAYPEYNWVPWKFNWIRRGYMKSTEHRRKFFDELGKELGIQTLDDWYQKLSSDVLNSNGGRSLMTTYRNSPVTALMAAYPEHNWIPWKFNVVPRNYWRQAPNLRKFFDYLGKKIGVQTRDDWYQKLSFDLVVQNGGIGFLTTPQHKNSPSSALIAAYPEHNWAPWKFNTVSKGFWESQDNIKHFLSELSEKLSIQTLDDWYRVDLEQLNIFGANSLISKYKGLYNILKEQYPNHPWDLKRFKQTKKKGQRWLAVTLKKMFPNEEILEDYMHPKAVFLSSNRTMQLDVFIPSRSLAFEYQGEQHYEDIGIFSPTKTYQQRDEEKRNLCAANNIKLIEVPYWWNRSQESLQKMITENKQHVLL